ncbi:MAG: hypothetical protein LBP25_06800 [Tannerellaceae bacterium]|jgi:hypothetical protein|nr:hypothetical protein [Tannerellaceae bacterium]
MSTDLMIIIIAVIVLLALLFFFFQSRYSRDKQAKPVSVLPDRTPAKRGYPVERVHEYLRRDYEKVGYEDAIANQDTAYKEQRLKEIKSGGTQLCEEIILKYNEDIEYLNVRIEIYKRDGLQDSEKEYTAKKTVYLQHIERIRNIQENLEKGEETIFDSYNRGFAKGQRAKGMELLNKYGSN